MPVEITWRTLATTLRSASGLRESERSASRAAGGVEGIAVGGALLAKNIGTAAKAYGPKLAEDWKAGAERLKTATGVGHVAAEQTTAALTDYTRSAVVGAGVSAGAALAQHVVHAVTHHPQKTAPIDCPRP